MKDFYQEQRRRWLNDETMYTPLYDAHEGEERNARRWVGVVLGCLLLAASIYLC